MNMRLLFVLYLLFIGVVLYLAYTGTLQPLLSPRFYLDKVGHFVLIGLMAYLAHRALNRRMFRAGRFMLPLAPVYVAVLITGEECLQLLSPYRTFSFSDIAANLLGIFCFWLADRAVNC